MRRRDVIALFAAAWPLAARAKQAIPVIGVLTNRASGADAHLLAALRDGLAAAGFVEGRNLTIEYRFADYHNDRLPALAADLVRRQVALIFANGVSAIAAKAATATVPIVFTSGGDPVRSGLVGRLDYPGGNATGAVTTNIGMGPKRLALLTELVPGARKIGFLFNPASPLTDSPDMQAAAAAAGRQLSALPAASGPDLTAAFAEGDRQRIEGLVVGADPLFVSRRDEIAALAARVPTVYFGREFIEARGLMSYAARLADAYREAGIYAGRILKGEKPADLPVKTPARYDLVLNLKAAKALGLEVPPALLARADEVIE